MKLIKISATDSTNAAMKRLLDTEGPEDGTLLWSDFQSEGRGQRGASWQSEPGKNLTFSLLKEDTFVKTQDQFGITMAVSMAVSRVLKARDIPEVRIKWPNDILSGRLKICGILIENTLQGAYIRRSIIGIGLNVNQQAFEGLPRAASLRMVTGEELDREPLLLELRTAILEELERLVKCGAGIYRKGYEGQLFGMGESMRFRLPGGEAFRAVILGVGPRGKLQLRKEDGTPLACGFKEIEMLY